MHIISGFEVKLRIARNKLLPDPAKIQDEFWQKYILAPNPPLPVRARLGNKGCNVVRVDPFRVWIQLDETAELRIYDIDELRMPRYAGGLTAE